jgi:hypothetical protein
MQLKGAEIQPGRIKVNAWQLDAIWGVAETTPLIMRKKGVNPKQFV